MKSNLINWGGLRPLAFVLTTLASLFAMNLQAQATGSITGQVGDEYNPGFLNGVTVRVQGTSIVTSTNRFGEYTLLNVPSGQQSVIFSYVGYETQILSTTVVSGQTAQVDATMSAEVLLLEAFQVQGGRIVGTARALNQQKTAESFRSIIASDAIGQLPDENVAEALNRMPGVSIARDQGEGRFAIIRGIDPQLNSYSINGVTIGAPEDGARSVALDILPSEMISTLEVTKVITPDMDADAIGGAIDIQIKSPFDENGRILRGSFAGTYSDLRGEFGNKVSLTYGDLFQDGTVGFIIGVSNSEKRFGSDNTEVDGNWSDEGNGAFAPDDELETREYNINRYRQNVTSALEFKPDEGRYFYIKGSLSEFSDMEARYRTEIKPGEGDVEEATSNRVLLTGVAETDRDVKDRFEKQLITSIVAGGEIELGNSFIDFQAAYSYSEEEEPFRLDTDFRFEDSDLTLEILDADTYTPRVNQLAGPSIFDPSNFAFDGITREDNISEEEVIEFEINYRYDFLFADNPTYFKTGAKATLKTKSTDVEVSENDEDPEGLETLADVVQTDGRFTFLEGPYASQTAIRDLFNANPGAFAMERNDEDSTTADYQSTEHVVSTYLMAGTQMDKVELTAGVRLEKTFFETDGFSYDIIETDAVEGEFISERGADRDYIDFFPFLGFNYEYTENLIFRGAISQTIARPRFDQSAARRLVEQEEDEGEISTSVEVGNPNLEPFESTNIDLSVEYYTENLGVLSVAFFYKSIDNYIYDIQTDEVGLFGAQEAEVASFANGDEATITGVEFNINRQLTFLPEALDGFGINANLTLSESDAEDDTLRPGDSLALPLQSDTIGTIALYYQNHGFNFRIAGTYRSEYLDEFGGELSEDRWVDEHFQWDLSASYDVNDNVNIFADVININNEPFRAYFDVSNRLSQFEEYSWSGRFGVKINL